MVQSMVNIYLYYRVDLFVYLFIKIFDFTVVTVIFVH